MAWTATMTFTTGNVLTAAQMNSYSRDNLNFLHSPPGCLAQRTTAQVIANNTATAVSFNGTDIYDTDSMHDPVGSPTTITFNTAGVYLVTASFQFAANATGSRWMSIGASSFEIAGTKDTGPTSGIDSYMTASAHWKAAATDAATCFVQQTSGGNLSITNSGASTLTGSTPAIIFGAQWISDGT